MSNHQHLPSTENRAEIWVQDERGLRCTYFSLRARPFKIIFPDYTIPTMPDAQDNSRKPTGQTPDSETPRWNQDRTP